MLWFLLQSCSVILNSFFKCSFYHLPFIILPFTFPHCSQSLYKKMIYPSNIRFSVLSIQLLKMYHYFVRGVLFIILYLKQCFGYTMQLPGSQCVCVHVCVQSCLTLCDPYGLLTRDQTGDQQCKYWVLTTGLPGNSLIYSFYIKILFFSFKFLCISYL